jgi:hypothetical protein
MATVKASETGIATLRHCQELSGKSWEVVAEESRVAKATIFKLLKGNPVTKEVVNDLAKHFKLERRQIVTDREWYPQWSGRSTGDLWKLLQDEAREDSERFRAIKAADKPTLVREAHHQAKQTLTEQIDRLERKLSANVPELRQLQQDVTLPAIFAALPDDSCAIEFYRFNVYNFAGNGWQDPQYVAFILAPGGKVELVKLGDAGEIDRLIDRYRDLAGDVNLPSFGARPKAANSLSIL